MNAAAGSRFPVAGVSLAVLLLTVGSTDLFAQGDRWDRQVNQVLDSSARTLQARGYHPVGSPRTGLLMVDQSDRIEIPVQGNAEYVVVGSCDADCSALQMVISNPTGYEIDAARAPGTVPIVRVIPPILPGAYRLTVTMAGCRVSPCRYGLTAFNRLPARRSTAPPVQ